MPPELTGQGSETSDIGVLIAGIKELRDFLRKEATKTDTCYTCYTDQAAYIVLRLDDLLNK